MNNLTPEWIKFAEKGLPLGMVVQEIIDRMQYAPNFFTELNSLLEKHESPFEYVNVEGESVRQLKSHYTNKSESNDA